MAQHYAPADRLNRCLLVNPLRADRFTVSARHTNQPAAELHRYLAKVDIPIMIVLLGGPPRVGKSIISSEIRQKHAVSVVSTDTLGAVLENVLSPEAAPDLFAFWQV